MSKFSIEIRVDDPGADFGTADPLTGFVDVLVYEKCECRNLELQWELRREHNRNAQVLHKGSANVTRWATWKPDKSYSYPFSFVQNQAMGGGLQDATWFVRAGFEISGDFAPIHSDWQPVSLLGNSVQTNSDTSIDPRPDLPLSADASIASKAQEAAFHSEAVSSDKLSNESKQEAPGLEFTLNFSKPDRKYQFGEMIKGHLLVQADREYQIKHLGVKYGWRTHGRTAPDAGEAVLVSIARDFVWQTGETYRYDFKFRVDQGPATEHGHNHNLDWYLWPQLDLPDDQHELDLESAIKYAEDEFFLLGGSLRVVQSSISTDSWVMIVALLLGSVLGLTIITLVPKITDRFSIDGDWFILIGIGAVIFGFIAIRAAYQYKLAEIFLGEVLVDISSQEYGEGIQSTVQFTPKRDVFFQKLVMKLLVEEVVTIREGTSTRTKRHPIYQTTTEKRLHRQLRSGTPFTGTMTIVKIPKTVPNSGRVNMTTQKSSWFSAGGEESREIAWSIGIYVGIQNWFKWNRKHPIKVYRH